MQDLRIVLYSKHNVKQLRAMDLKIQIWDSESNFYETNLIKYKLSILLPKGRL